MESTGIPLDEWTEDMLEDVTPVERVHVSKHRAGRQPKMSRSEKRRRDEQKRQRIQDIVTANAIRKAVDGPGT